MSLRRTRYNLQTTLINVLGADVAAEFIAVAERQTGKPVRFMTAADIDTPRLQKELEAIEARQWLRHSRARGNKQPNSLGELKPKSAPCESRANGVRSE